MKLVFVLGQPTSAHHGHLWRTRVATIDPRKYLPTLKRSIDEKHTVLSDGIIALERNPSDVDQLDTVLRHLHTLKGETHMMGFVDLSEICHKEEDVFKALQAGTLASIQGEIADLMLRGIDALRNVVNAELEGRSYNLDLRALVTQIQGVTVPQSAQPSPPTPVPQPTAPPPFKVVAGDTEPQVVTFRARVKVLGPGDAVRDGEVERYGIKVGNWIFCVGSGTNLDLPLYPTVPRREKEVELVAMGVQPSAQIVSGTIQPAEGAPPVWNLFLGAAEWYANGNKRPFKAGNGLFVTCISTPPMEVLMQQE